MGCKKGSKEFGLLFGKEKLGTNPQTYTSPLLDLSCFDMVAIETSMAPEWMH